MGYTHYWRTPKELPADKFAAIVADAQKIFIACEQQGITLAGGLGKGEPEANEERIWFNGSKINGEDHETFYLYQRFPTEDLHWCRPDKNGRYFSFCKTTRKPYDIVVCAVLMAVKDHLQQTIIVKSDGDLSREWIPAFALYEKLFGKFRAETVRKCLLEDFEKEE